MAELDLAPPAPALPARLLTIAYSAALFFWLSAEDNGTLSVTLFGAAGCALLLYWGIVRRWADRDVSAQQWRFAGLVLGALFGAGTAVVTTLLMFFKTAWHSHLFPDYPTPMLLAMLERAPIWALAGILLATALLLAQAWHRGRRLRSV